MYSMVVSSCLFRLSSSSPSSSSPLSRSELICAWWFSHPNFEDISWRVCVGCQTIWMSSLFSNVSSFPSHLLFKLRGFQCHFKSQIISYTSYSRTNDCIYNGYDNINLEPNAMNNIDTVAHMNMHYTQY